MNYDFNYSNNVERDVEKFIQNAVIVFEDLKLSNSEEDKLVIFMILADLERFGNKVISNSLETVNSYNKLGNFITEIYDKYKNKEEIFGIKYFLLKPTDFSYKVALDMIKPIYGKINTIEPSKDRDYRIVKRELDTAIQYADTILTVWDRPVAEIHPDKVLVAKHV